MRKSTKTAEKNASSKSMSAKNCSAKSTSTKTKDCAGSRKCTKSSSAKNSK